MSSIHAAPEAKVTKIFDAVAVEEAVKRVSLLPFFPPFSLSFA